MNSSSLHRTLALRPRSIAMNPRVPSSRARCGAGAIGPETRAFVERHEGGRRGAPSRLRSPAMTFSPSAVLLFDREDVDVAAAARAHVGLTLAAVALPTS